MGKNFKLLITALIMLIISSCASIPFIASKNGNYRGFQQYYFTVEGKKCQIVLPDTPAEGKPWVWRARFWGHEGQFDQLMLDAGYAVAHIDTADMFGSPAAMEIWDKFYEFMTIKGGYNSKPVLEGMSRGGLFVFNWAHRNPDKTAGIYADNPVCDLASWPAGTGKGKGTTNTSEWKKCCSAYNLSSEQALSYCNDPVDKAADLAQAGIPLILVCGDSDSVVPFAENGALMQKAWETTSTEFKLILKPGADHHPHSLEDPAPISNFFLKSFSLPAIFSDGMVLQRDQQIPVWGTAASGSTVTVTFAGQTKATVTDDNGFWRINLDPVAAGRNFFMEINSGDKTISFKDIAVGEVWICSGQSNMQWMLSQSDDFETFKAEAENYPELRLFSVKRQGQEFVYHDFETEKPWVRCSSKEISNFSAIAYHFGKNLNRKLDVPVGVISVNQGGSYAECWMSKEVMNERPFTATFYNTFKKRFPNYTNEPYHWITGLYNGMLKPLIPYAIKGAIWYQGETNVEAPQEYALTFPRMIKQWRDEWKQGKFPFLYVQLAQFNYGKDKNNNAAILRQVQKKTQNVENTAMITIQDIGNFDDIHPTNKHDVGKRLYAAALTKAYGIDTPYSGPVAESASVIEPGKIEIKFSSCYDGLSLETGTNCFEVISGSTSFIPEKIVVQNSSLILYYEKSVKPSAVSFAWIADKPVRLMNSEGLSAGPFKLKVE